MTLACRCNSMIDLVPSSSIVLLSFSLWSSLRTEKWFPNFNWNYVFSMLFASQILRSVVFLLACFSLLQIAYGSLKLHLPLSKLLNTVGFLKTVLQCRCGWSEFLSSCLVIYTSTLARRQLWDNKWPQIDRIVKCFTT